MSKPSTSVFDAATCRHLLTTTAAPAAGLMTIASLTASLDPSTAIALSYVPDQLVLARSGFDAYVAARAQHADTTPEALANSIAADVANELVPRWLRVTVNRSAGGIVNHSVTVEDRQPGWDHTALHKSP